MFSFDIYCPECNKTMEQENLFVKEEGACGSIHIPFRCKTEACDFSSSSKFPSPGQIAVDIFRVTHVTERTYPLQVPCPKCGEDMRMDRIFFKKTNTVDQFYGCENEECNFEHVIKISIFADDSNKATEVNSTKNTKEDKDNER